MIAIKNMKNIPNRCIECELKSGGYCYHKNPPYNLSESDMLKEKPTDCPLTEIVTCCDCVYGVFGECKKFHHYTMKDDFCSFGKRRE